MIPECVHIRDVEDQPPPATHGFTLFQIEDRRLDVFCAQGREPRAFSTVKNFHAQNIAVKPHRLRHVPNSKSDRRNFLNRRRHTPPSLPRLSLNLPAERHTVDSDRGRWRMAYVIAEPCIGTKDTACV